MRGTLRQIVQSTLKVDWTQLEAAAALRCTGGVAVPLFIGVAIQQPSIAVFGAVGAVGVGFGSFQGAYRSRAEVMLYAAAGMALSIFFGSLAGHSAIGAVVAAAVWGFAGGLLVALGPAASFVGLQSIVALLVAGGYPSNVRDAAGRAALVFAGGLVQTLLVVMIWPLQRFSAERKSLATAYRSLADYAAAIPTTEAAAPEPHTFAGTASPLSDPQPFARSRDVLVFQSLLDEAERIRASLARFAAQYRRLQDSDQSCARGVAALVARALSETAASLEEMREPEEPPDLWRSLDDCAQRLSHAAAVDALLGQIRAAWRTAGVLTAEPTDTAPRRARVVPLRRRPPIGDAMATLRANLTLGSTACRHALRLAATLAIATAVYRGFSLPRGYWLPMTVVLVLRPEFYDTFARGTARIAGTIVGAAVATLVVHAIEPGAVGLTVLVLVSVYGAYALARASYALLTVCITGYIVFLLMLAGVPELLAVTYRIEDTVAGGLLALCAYALWPTWAANEVRPALANMLDAHADYLTELFAAYNDPRHPGLRTLEKIRSDARLTRSNAEMVIERMLAEPAGRPSFDPRIAVGLLAAIRRHALAGLALHAALEREGPGAAPGIDVLAAEMTSSLHALATALRHGTPPPPLPPLRQTQLAFSAQSNDLVRDETDLMVDSINTMAELLQRDAHSSADPAHQ